ncbi:MAG: hypothetical protein H7246_11115, partial [Phycisphaerae bacterium]|nr:hypothetical protein [Saprospiraceae bacterium]
LRKLNFSKSCYHLISHTLSYSNNTTMRPKMYRRCIHRNSGNTQPFFQPAAARSERSAEGSFFAAAPEAYRSAQQTGGKEATATSPAPSAAPKPGPTPPAPIVAPKPVITHKTLFKAPNGAANTRKTVGIGEVVEFAGNAAGNWSASNGTPLIEANKKVLKWTAPERANTTDIILEIGGKQDKVTMKTIEPEDIIGKKKSDHTDFKKGVAGAGMSLRFHYLPKKVSFGNCEAKEVSDKATDITGYYRKHYTDEQLKHDSGDTFTSIQENNQDSALDNARTNDPYTPWEKGTFVWVIPNKFRVKTESGDGEKFKKDVTQSFTMVNKKGKITITKATTSCERTP